MASCGETKYPFHRHTGGTFLFQFSSSYNSHSYHIKETNGEVARQASPIVNTVLRAIDNGNSCNYGPLQLQVKNLPKDMNCHYHQVTETEATTTYLLVLINVVHFRAHAGSKTLVCQYNPSAIHHKVSRQRFHSPHMYEQDQLGPSKTVR